MMKWRKRRRRRLHLLSNPFSTKEKLNLLTS
jgi:hypothetical protein